MKRNFPKKNSSANCKEHEIEAKNPSTSNTDLTLKNLTTDLNNTDLTLKISTTDLNNSSAEICKNIQPLSIKENHNNEKPSIKKKILKLFSDITVEPILCFYTFPQLLSQIAISNLQFQTACRVNLGLNETICDDILRVNNSEYEMLVQKEAAKLLVWKKPVSTLIPALLILFIGSFSDRYKIR